MDGFVDEGLFSPPSTEDVGVGEASVPLTDGAGVGVGLELSLVVGMVLELVLDSPSATVLLVLSVVPYEIY